MASFQSFLVTLFLVSSSSGLGICPEGTIDYADRKECLYAVNATTSYATAKQVCRNLGGQPVKIRDIFENGISGAEAGSQIGLNALSYIGVIKGADGTWLYDDGTQLEYHNWNSGESNSTSSLVDSFTRGQLNFTNEESTSCPNVGHPLTGTDCAVISSDNNRWTSVRCDALYTFICTMSDYLDSCPRGWVLYKDSCYFFFNPQLIYPTQSFTLSNAQISCQTMSANLVSIHSDDEYNFLLDQISTSPPTSIDCRYSQTLIGFTCDASVYKWLDGSLVDYNKGRSECYASYGIINDTRCGETAYWATSPSSYYRYICKKSPTPKVTIDSEDVHKKVMIL